MLDEGGGALVGGVGGEDSCGRWKMEGGKGRSVKGTMDELRRMGVRCRWTSVRRVGGGW